MIDYASEIKRRVTTTEAAQYYGIEVNRSGFCCCPFHGEKTASLKLYPGERGFYCFGCHAHGSVIDFVMLLFGIPFKDALNKINDDFRLGLPIGKRPTLRSYRESQRIQHERKKQIKEREAKGAEYDSALTEYAKIDKIISSFDENTPDFPPELVYALQNKDRAEYELDLAGGKLYNGAK